jgi:hypothetical protein
MKRFTVLCAVAFAIVFLAPPTYAAKICFQDQFGELFQLKGGKLDKKSYTVKVDVPGFCVVSGHAEITLNGSGQLVLGMLTSHDLGGACLSVRWVAVGNGLVYTGSFDQNGDGTIDGSITFTNVSCTSFPPFGPDKPVTPNPNSPLVKKQ